jgi:Uma2 family endonuclease
MSISTATDSIQPRRFTTDEQRLMDDAGIFGPEECLELIDGVLYVKHLGEPRRFTADEYERIADAGVIRDDERTELIDGEIVVMSRIGSPHSATVKRLIRMFTEALGRRVLVSVQDPIRLDEGNEPEPDVALLRPRDDDYKSGHARPPDIFLVVEVMDTSAPYDRRVKTPRYARHGIAEVWLVDLAEELIEVHRRPSGSRYKSRRTCRVGQQVAPEAFPDVVLDVAEILVRVPPP